MMPMDTRRVTSKYEAYHDVKDGCDKQNTCWVVGYGKRRVYGGVVI